MSARVKHPLDRPGRALVTARDRAPGASLVACAHPRKADADAHGPDRCRSAQHVAERPRPSAAPRWTNRQANVRPFRPAVHPGAPVGPGRHAPQPEHCRTTHERTPLANRAAARGAHGSALTTRSPGLHVYRDSPRARDGPLRTARRAPYPAATCGRPHAARGPRCRRSGSAPHRPGATARRPVRRGALP